ncbi:MAG: DUF1761 domain-containing protein [Gammaproteobacteria bacterium]|nr:DUF1761 domain-containing protein [Gammaproteobacteria bacterium]
MEITVNFEFVNWWAVLGATVTSFILAGVWYAPTVFGRFGLPDGEVVNVHTDQDKNVQLIFVIAFLFHWLTAGLLAAVLGPNATITYGIVVGMLIGCFFVTTAQGISSIFDRRPIVRIFVNGGYHIVSLSIMGGIIGAFN